MYPLSFVCMGMGICIFILGVGHNLLAIINGIKNDTDRTKAAEIFRLHYSTMMYTAKSILIDDASAEDAVSDAMIKIINNLDKISDVSCDKTKGYIAIIVRNTALNLIKKQANRKEDTDEALGEIPDSDISILDKLTNDESCKIINEAIISLPKHLSDVLRLSIVYGYDNKKIAKLLNVNYDLVRQRLSRAKKSVKKILCKTGEYNGR